MKSVNKKERASAKIKFIAIYGVTIVSIVIVLSAFWSPTKEIKTVVVEKKLQPKEIIKEIKVPVIKEVKVPVIREVKVGDASQSNSKTVDSLLRIINTYNKDVNVLSSKNESQKQQIADLQKSLNTNSRVQRNVSSSPTEADEKERKFYDWALRSQVAITNNLTKENNELKAKIASMSKQ